MFDKAWRMSRYNSDYIEKCLIEQNGINPVDAATIVRLAKELDKLDCDVTDINAQEPMAGFT